MTHTFNDYLNERKDLWRELNAIEAEAIKEILVKKH